MRKLMILWLVGCFCLAGYAQSSFSRQELQDLVNRKQYAVALACADSIRAASPVDYEALYVLGQAYEGMFRYPDAYTLYEQCLESDTTDIDYLNALARTAINLGRASEAERLFHKVLATDSTHFYANYQLARLYSQLGEYDKAIEKYEYLQEQDKDNAVLYRNIGDCCSRQDDWQGAAIAYFHAYNLNRENAGLASALINTLLRLGGDYVEEAVAVCDTALYYNPGNRLLRRNKGMSLYICRRYAEADSLYSSLLAEGDSTYLNFKYGGASKYYAGQYLASIEPLDIAYEQDTTSIEVCLLLGSALGKTFDRERAYDLLKRAEEGMKPNPLLVNQLLFFRAETYKNDGRREEAARLYYQLWQRNPERTDVLASLCALYNVLDIHEYKNETERQRGLFAEVLYLNQVLEKRQPLQGADFHSFLLQSLYEDLFFKSVTEQPLLAPDGKKSTLSIVDLKSLINRLPEIPEPLLKDMKKVVRSREEAKPSGDSLKKTSAN